MMEDPGKVSIQALEKSAEDDERNVVEVIPDFKDKDRDSYSRKRSQNEMEPTAFELPRATKFPHKDAPPLPTFSDDSPPQLSFAEGHEDVFQARLSSSNSCIQPTQPLEEDMSVQEYSTTFITPPNEETDEKNTFIVESPVAAAQEPLESPLSPSEANRTSPDFNKTLDMTLRSSGATAFGLGVLLAIDEMLDPLVGFLLPYGMRRRGANLAVTTATIIISGLAWVISSKRW